MARLGAYEPAGLELLDIHQLELDEAIKHQMLKNLHLKTADGSFKIGLDANIAAWEHTRWGWAWQSLRLPGAPSKLRVSRTQRTTGSGGRGPRGILKNKYIII